MAQESPYKALDLYLPNAELQAQLDEAVDNGHYDSEIRPETPPIDAGNTVNGEPWGWVWGTKRFWLLPLDFQARAVELASAGAWFTESMTGMVITSLVLYTEAASMFWLHNDIDGDKVLDVTYAPNPQREAQRAFDELFDSPEDPGCDACQYTGWSLTLDAEPTLAPNAVEYGLTLLFPLCDEHRRGGRVHNSYGETYTWTGEQWVVGDGGEQ